MKYTNSAQEAGHIVFVHPSLMGGGAERVSLALASYFVSHGIRFTYFLTKSNVIEYDVPDGVEVCSEFADASLKPLDQVKLIRRFVSERPKATVISFLPHQNMYTLMATIGLPNRVIVSVRNDPRYDFPGNKILPFIRNMLYRRSDAIVFQTKSQASLMPRYLQTNSKIILNPISSELPEPYSGLRRKAIVTAGRLELQKNHSMTIRSFELFHKKHPEYILEIFGKGSLQSELENLVHSLDMDDSIKFMGFSSDALLHIRARYRFIEAVRSHTITREHIAPLIQRYSAELREASKLYEPCISGFKSDVSVISLLNVNLEQKKIVPLVVAKTLYQFQKERGQNERGSSAHLVIDEAHNVLSYSSQRESENWRDYRLETFEEIVKEGRKFGMYLIVCSQRPADISPTILSQMHNYFIHRLVNDEDLRAISKAVSFIDSANASMIPVLPQGCCIVSGTATTYPVRVQVDVLELEKQPMSFDRDLAKAWGVG